MSRDKEPVRGFSSLPSPRGLNKAIVGKGREKIADKMFFVLCDLSAFRGGAGMLQMSGNGMASEQLGKGKMERGGSVGNGGEARPPVLTCLTSDQWLASDLFCLMGRERCYHI